MPSRVLCKSEAGFGGAALGLLDSGPHEIHASFPAFGVPPGGHAAGGLFDLGVQAFHGVGGAHARPQRQADTAALPVSESARGPSDPRPRLYPIPRPRAMGARGARAAQACGTLPPRPRHPQADASCLCPDAARPTCARSPNRPHTGLAYRHPDCTIQARASGRGMHMPGACRVFRKPAPRTPSRSRAGQEGPL